MSCSAGSISDQFAKGSKSLSQSRLRHLRFHSELTLIPLMTRGASDVSTAACDLPRIQ